MNKKKIEKAMETHKIIGASIAYIQQGKLYELDHYGLKRADRMDKIDDHGIFNLCSISKFITSVLVLKMVSRGVFSLDKPINEYLRSWKVPEDSPWNAHGVTLRRLLSHQAGFADPTGSFGVHHGQVRIPDLLQGKTAHYKGGASFSYEPGTDFLYSDTGYSILEVLIEDVFGDSFYTLLEKEVFLPLQMKDTWSNGKPLKENLVRGHRSNGLPLRLEDTLYPYPAAAGIWMSAGDLGLLVAELYAALKGGGKLGITKSLAKEMMSPQGKVAWSGLGVFLDHAAGHLEFSSLGWGEGFQGMIVGLPSKEAAIIVLTNTNTGRHQMEGFIGQLVRHFLKREAF